MIERVKQAAQESRWIWENTPISRGVTTAVKQYTVVEERIQAGLASGQFTMESQLVPPGIDMVG